ncbi:hypothetical protein J6369_14035, partial [Leptospira interrogans serovar Copenhageni]
SPSISVVWKLSIEVVLLNSTIEFFNNSNINFLLFQIFEKIELTDLNYFKKKYILKIGYIKK